MATLTGATSQGSLMGTQQHVLPAAPPWSTPNQWDNIPSSGLCITSSMGSLGFVGFYKTQGCFWQFLGIPFTSLARLYYSISVHAHGIQDMLTFPIFFQENVAVAFYAFFPSTQSTTLSCSGLVRSAGLHKIQCTVGASPFVHLPQGRLWPPIGLLGSVPARCRERDWVPITLLCHI